MCILLSTSSIICNNIGPLVVKLFAKNMFRKSKFYVILGPHKTIIKLHILLYSYKTMFGLINQHKFVITRPFPLTYILLMCFTSSPDDFCADQLLNKLIQHHVWDPLILYTGD